MDNGTYLVAVTVKDCEKKRDRRLAANRRTVAFKNIKVRQKTADELLYIGRTLDVDDGTEIVETAIALYAKLLREGVKVA